MRRLSAIVRPRSSITDSEVAVMYRLYARYYAATSTDRFDADLAGKDWVIELREGPALRGFSTLALTTFDAAAIRGRAIFSGDTIIDHRFWGEQALPEAFCRFAGATWRADPESPLYWFLITKGHRTYRYLRSFAREYWPRPELPMPPAARAIVDALAAARFGDAYDPARGVVAFAESRGHLAPDWAAIPPALSARPEVRFFVARNPRHAAGEELCCLAQLVPSNLRSLARRAFLEGFHASSGQTLLPDDRWRGGALPRRLGASALDPAPAFESDPRP